MFELRERAFAESDKAVQRGFAAVRCVGFQVGEVASVAALETGVAVGRRDGFSPKSPPTRTFCADCWRFQPRVRSKWRSGC